MKKIVLATLFLSALLSSQIQASQSPVHLGIRPTFVITKEVAEWLLIGSAAVGGAALIYHLYNYFFNLSDAQELQRAECLCSKATNEHERILFIHGDHLALLSLPDTKIATQLRAIVRINYCKTYPYIAYANDLDKALSTLRYRRNDLLSCKTRIEKRKAKIIDKPHDEMSEREQHYFINRYSHQEEVIQQLLDNLQVTSMRLQQLERHIIALPEYHQEEMMCRLERIQQQVNDVYWNQQYHHYYHHNNW